MAKLHVSIKTIVSEPAGIPGRRRAEHARDPARPASGSPAARKAAAPKDCGACTITWSTGASFAPGSRWRPRPRARRSSPSRKGMADGEALRIRTAKKLLGGRDFSADLHAGQRGWPAKSLLERNPTSERASKVASGWPGNLLPLATGTTDKIVRAVMDTAADMREEPHDEHRQRQQVDRPAYQSVPTAPTQGRRPRCLCRRHHHGPRHELRFWWSQQSALRMPRSSRSTPRRRKLSSSRHEGGHHRQGADVNFPLDKSGECWAIQDMRWMASHLPWWNDEKVLFAGHPVAAVAATTEEDHRPRPAS